MDLDKLFYSLIPLLIIIAISWFFSFLGSKANKARQEAESVPGYGSGTENRDRLLDLISLEEDDEEEGLVRSQHAYTEDARTDESGPFPDWEAIHGRGSPVVTPDPIKPKWWGA